MSDPDLDVLRHELAELAAPEKKGGRSASEERIIAGFEDIQRFVEQNGRPPQHGEDRDIFERLYAVRLDRLRELEECRTILAPYDNQRLLAGAGDGVTAAVAELDDDELRAELGGTGVADDIRQLRHVRPTAEKRAAEEIANREKCEDFDRFKSLFEQVQAELNAGVREARQFKRDAEVLPGQFFILGGQKAYVHDLGPEFTTPEGRINRRMRVIFDNATESNALLRSFQRALYKPENNGRRISDQLAGPLFADAKNEDDLSSGTIYVLRSKSNHPTVAAQQSLIHKVGVTTMPVAQRIAAAKLDPTFLMAEVEIVATYELFNISRTKLEKLIHRVLAPARLNIAIPDRFGNNVEPREWFLVPVFVIDEVVDRIRDGSLVNYRYRPDLAKLVRANE